MNGDSFGLRRGVQTTPPPRCVITGLIFLIYLSSLVTATGRIAFMDHSINSSLVLTQTTLDFSMKSFRIAFSFLTCNEGQLLYQRGSSGDFLRLYLQDRSFFIQWKSSVTEILLNFANHLEKNIWYFLDIYERTGDLKLKLFKSGSILIQDIIIANSSYRTSIFRIDLSGNSGLKIGGGAYTGCFMEGPFFPFVNNVNIVHSSVVWNDTECPLSSSECQASQDGNDCWNDPCLNGGTCNDLLNSYNCTCPHLFNGTNCENDLSIYGCSVLPCLNGGSCLDENDGNRNYKCSCVAGFKGTNCENSINECASGPCVHGTCIDEVNNYSCNCTGTGYSGTNCQSDINECDNLVVCGSGTCFNTPGSFTCQCPTGFDGNQCQNDINDCSSSPCRNGATCIDGIASYSCTCVTGFEGTDCENNTDDCLNKNCVGENVVCVDGINSHSCECKPGYTGSPTNCVDIDECTSNPCRNGATCQNLENAYNCSCKPGFTGNLCQSDINECSPNPCQHGAACEDLENNYQCTCLPGYSGRNCETDINECEVNNQPCKNNAVCIDLINDYSCNCSAGWTGQHCDIDINECIPDPCQNGATCHNYQNYYNCTCVPGYDGINCENNINDCSPNPCQNGGTCRDLVNGYNCQCGDAWMGKNCSDVYDACSFTPCKNGATCSTTKPQKDYSCACVIGFTGNDCETNIDDCKAESCLLPLVCFDLVNNYTCACPTGFTGVNCTEEINECASIPCQHGGTCIDHIGNYTCQCDQTFVNLTRYGNGEKLEFLTGYDGVNCEIDIDECALKPSICLNNGTCRGGRVGDYTCQCGPDVNGIYTAGKNCELRTSYCESDDSVKDDLPACKNGGTCISGDRSFSCICAPGFTGTRCKTDIDECESSPCQYNGTCIDGINNYTCQCIPGITGPNCGIDINECESLPCQNGGQCHDRINGYDCNCTDTGFNGTECQYNIDDCAILDPCQNNASCTDLVKDYNCTCFEGYKGKNCEIDIDECESNPCQYNGTCTQRSIKSEPDFSYFTAAGYDCSCIPGITGVNCEIDIDECVNNTCQFGSTCVDHINGYTCKCAPGYRGDRCQTEINECEELQPCQNGAVCKDKVADYDCLCREFFNGKQYAGKNCTVELTSCANNNCLNGATCRPYLVDEATNSQDYRCACQNGFTGDRCETATTMSFNNNSFIKYTLPDLSNNTVSIRFRTTLSNGILFAWDGIKVTSKLFCTLELSDGMLYISYQSGGVNNAETKYFHFPYLLNDSFWHEIELVQTTMLSFELKSSKCSANCSFVVSYTKEAADDTIWFGKPENTFKTSKSISKSHYIGCMQDIHINSVVLTHGSLSTDTSESVNVVDGCPRTEQCFPFSCNERGTCIDLWYDYQCVCERPYHSKDCEKNFTAATFAGGDTSSWTSFDISSLSATLRTTVDVSFFFRTRETKGLMMFLGNQGNTYITIELYQGYVLSRVVLCNYRQAFYINQTRFNKGKQHLTRISIKNNVFTLSIDSFSVSDTLPTPQSPCPLNANYLFFGGKLPDNFGTGRRKRATDFTISVLEISDLSQVGRFKGTIQDIELNSRKLLFYPEPTISSILADDNSTLQKGEVTDDICISFPCENNGTCSNVFFNDFSCLCPHGFIGKNCSELDFCKDDSCPDGSECHTLSDGFECISTATFSGSTQSPTLITYTKHINTNRQINEVTFKFRTIVRNGHIMLIKDANNYYIKIEMTGGNLVVTFKLDDLAPRKVIVDLIVSDKSWYMASLKEEGQMLKLTISGNNNEVSNSVDKSNSAISLHTLINHGTSSPSIELGFTNSLGTVDYHYYSGCLTEVRIGGILLPFYKQSDFKNFTTEQYFEVNSINHIEIGCNGGTGCTYHQCKHGTSCLPEYYGYQCNCTGSGYEGDWCQTNVDDCEDGVCYEHFNQGKCVDKLNDFYCKCQTGYTGTRCEMEQTGDCTPDPCQNNGSCQEANGSWSCDCGTEYVGGTCEVSSSANCSQTPCKNNGQCQNLLTQTPSFECSCQVGYSGYLCETKVDFCEDLPCDNGGNCSSLSTDYQCSCPAGYTGKNCTTDINNCSPNTCQNGGECIDIVNGYICNCTENWDGTHCEFDVDECQKQPCQNDGKCRNTKGSFNCDCYGTGYQGQYCETDLDECTFSPCQNGANCTNFEGGYNCSCTLGYEGKNCTEPKCELVSCENGGTCRIADNKWSCHCVQYYFGQLCELKGRCADNPCNITNTDYCYQEDKVNGFYNCSCNTGWQGVHCDDDIDECDSGICQHSSTCTNTPGDYTCTCQPGYTDKNCATDIDDCAGQPCQNNGVCEDRVNDFYCDCNNTGYTNKTCSDDINECDQDKCQNFVRCDNKPGSYECICTPGYIGIQCTIKDPDYRKLDDENDIMWYIIGPIVAVILIAIVIVIIVFVMCARSKRATRGTYSPSRQEVTGSRVELGQVLKPPPEERLI